jgi:ADP-ribosyl-[dinitrogen reductase] hydrolase
MALCLANSLVARQGFVPYDQLVRYKWWNINGYMSSTGKCFDIGAATKQSVDEFSRRQKQFAKENNIEITQLDFLSDKNLLEKFDVMCSEEGVAGNGALMRLTPVPLFFYKYPKEAVEFCGISGQITHGDKRAYDACRYYGALIIAALHGEKKDQLIDKNFYAKHKDWFNGETLHPDIIQIAKGSYQKKGGYDDGIRGPGYIVKALEAALWAFWSDGNSFKTGALAAVNLGNDTDTTAAIYGQLAGACYGYRNLPPEWVGQVYAKKFIEILSKWMAYDGQRWQPEKVSLLFLSSTLLPNTLTGALPPSTPTTKSDSKTAVSPTLSTTSSSGGIFHSPLSPDNHSGTITSSTVPTKSPYAATVVSNFPSKSNPDATAPSTLRTTSSSGGISHSTISPDNHSGTTTSSTVPTKSPYAATDALNCPSKSNPDATTSSTLRTTSSSGGIFYSTLSPDNHSGTTTSSTVPSKNPYAATVVPNLPSKSYPDATASSTLPTMSSSGAMFTSALSSHNYSNRVPSSTVPLTSHYETAIVSDYMWNSHPDEPVSSTLPTKSRSVTITPATSSPQHYSHTIPSSTLSSQRYSGTMPPSPHKTNLYSPSTDNNNEVYMTSPLYFERTSRNKPSHEFEYDRHSQMSHPTSTDKQFESTSSTEFRNYNANMSNVGNTAAGTRFSRESHSGYRSTNKRKRR